MSYAEKWEHPEHDCEDCGKFHMAWSLQNKSRKTILSIPRKNFFVMLGAWAGIGGLLGYAVSDFVRMMNMVC